MLQFADDYLISGDDLYYHSDGRTTLPLGTITIQETKASKGYLINDTVYVRQITSEGNAEDVHTYNAPTEETAVKEQVIRGDIEFVKVGDSSLKRLANVPFTITSKTTGETHTVVTDANGYVNTSSEWTKHSQNTNAGTSSEDGVWFGMDKEGNEAAVNDKLGALPYDTYVLNEVRCEANQGYTLLKDIEFTVYKDNYTVNLGTLTDDMIKLETTATEAESGTQISYATDDVTIIDKVKYENVSAGQEYTLLGTLMDKATGEPIEIDGKEVTAEKTFTASSSNGSVKVEFNLDASSLRGKDVVVFEKLMYEDYVAASHEDINDEDQTITFLNPEIGTTAVDSKTLDHIALADDKVVIIDTVKYSGLIKGEEHTLTGTLVNAETGEPIKVNGKEVTASQTFTAPKSEGETQVIFSLDASELAGIKTVVYEDLSWDNKIITQHRDKDDEGQSVTFPEIGTTALDSDTLDHISYADDKVTIIDTVKYSGLIAGKEYTMKGTLMNAKTEKAIKVDGKEVTAETTFVAEASEGEVKMEFTLDASALAGTKSVVYEDLYYNGKIVSQHNDKSDEGQSIYFPEIKTKAYDKSENTNVIKPKKDLTIVDTVSYSNLITQSLISNVVSLEGEESTEGSTTDSLDTDALIKSLVDDLKMPQGLVDAYNEIKSTVADGTELTQDEEAAIVTKHISEKDLEAWLDSLSDEDMEKLYSTVMLMNMGDILNSFDNISVGSEYVLMGTLMDKETGEPLLVDGKPVTATMTFTPDKNDGSVNLEFPQIDGTKMDGKQLVVYEELYLHGKLVASHKDINDKSQTITISSTPQTGQTVPFVFGGLVVATMAGVYVFRHRKSVLD